MKLDFDCIIIGAGVAGMTSAIYLKRSGINVAIFEKNYVGGQINKTYTIKNYPGFKEIDGPTLSLAILEQVKDLNVPIIYEEVLNINDNGEYKEIETNKQKYICKAIIIASGKKERHLNLENEKELIGKGISWCATCDGNFFKEMDVAVVGGGNTAMEDALYLGNICNKVYVINRSNTFRADRVLLEQVEKKENIEIIRDKVVKKLIKQDNKLQGIFLNDGTKLEISGLFLAIGSDPVIEFLENIEIELDKNYIVVDNRMKTNIDGIYACGDIIKKDLYQIVTAAGEGATAANSVKDYLNNK